MKNNSTRLAVFVLSLILLASTSGCTNSTTDNSSGASSTSANGSQTSTIGGDKAAEPATLRMWIRASSKENNQTITIDEFNASQNDAKVEYEVYGDNYSEVLKLALSANEVPDIFDVGIDTGSIRAFISANYMAPLDEFYDEEYMVGFNPSAFKQFKYEDHVYIIPNATRYFRLYYNKTLFEKAGLDPNTPPQTLEELQEYAKKITDAGAGEYYGFGLPIKSVSTWERNVDYLAITNGYTGPWAFDYTKGRFDFAKQKPILEYFRNMFQSGVLMPGSESLDIEMIRANFATDKIGMYVDGSWMVNGFNNELEAAKNLNYDTAIIPVFAGQERAKDYLSLEGGHAIYSKSEHKAEAFQAIKYMLENIFEAPARKDPSKVAPSLSLHLESNKRINSQESVLNMKGVTGLLQGLDQLSSFPVVPSQLITLEGDNREAVYPLLVIGNQDIDSELQKLTETYNKALDKALADGTLSESDLKPEGFSYFTR